MRSQGQYHATQVSIKARGQCNPTGFLHGRIFLLLRAAHEEHTQIHSSLQPQQAALSAACCGC